MQLHLSDKWTRFKNVWCIGYAFTPHNDFLECEALASYFDDCKSLDDFQQRLATTNGMFAIIVDSPTIQLAATDPSRYYPIYFRYTSDCFSVSDSPYPLRKDGDTISQRSLLQYKASGAVYEGETLVEGILQVKPGHYCVFSNSAFSQVPFFTMAVLPSEVKSATPEDFIAVLENAFKRMVRSVWNRQLVIPLSGGLDSRLIVCLLKKLNYGNVLCYTIGNDDSPEVSVAKKVTQALDVRFIQVDPLKTPMAADKWWLTDDFTKYYRLLGNYGNFVWLYEYFAVGYLKHNHLVESDAVFVPGHSGDSMAGSHFIHNLVHENESAKSLALKILRYSNEYSYYASLKEDCVNWFEKELGKGYLPYSAFQSYIFRNRQAHQIINAARAYSHFGFDLRLPLWDAEVLSFMKCLPYDGLRRKTFYNNCLQHSIFEPMGVDFGGYDKTTDWSIRKQMLKVRIKQMLPNFIVHHFAHLKGCDGEYELMQPLLSELVANGTLHSRNDCVSVNQVIAEWYLMKVKQDLDCNNVSNT